jgi:hypothetical protein
MRINHKGTHLSDGFFYMPISGFIEKFKQKAKIKIFANTKSG